MKRVDEKLKYKKQNNERGINAIDISRVDFSDMDLRYFDLSKADLSLAHFNNTIMEGINLSDAKLPYPVNFSNANRNMQNCKLIRVKLGSGGRLDGLDLKNSDFTEADFSYGSLKGCNIKGCNLKDCNLKGCNLKYSNLSYSNLEGGNLSYSNLEGGNLSYSNLEGCNLEGCNLTGVKFSGASGLTYEQLSQAITLYGCHGIPADIEKKLKTEKSELFTKPKEGTNGKS